jgi:hypothetical protein
MANGSGSQSELLGQLGFNASRSTKVASSIRLWSGICPATIALHTGMNSLVAASSIRSKRASSTSTSICKSFLSIVILF